MDTSLPLIDRRVSNASKVSQNVIVESLLKSHNNEARMPDLNESTQLVRQRALTQIAVQQDVNALKRSQVSQDNYSELLKTQKLRGKFAEEASVIMHQPNVKNIALFLLVMSVAMCASQSGTYMNVCIPLFREKYNWDTQVKEDLNAALMNTLPAVGTIVGSGSGSVLMGYGRARAFLVAMSVGFIGSCITFFENWPVFLLAKFIVGISIGQTGVVVARYIEEYVPLKWFGTSQAISLAFLQSGIFLATIMAAILPPDEDTEELKSNGTWRIMFALQPILIIITVILFFIFVRDDTPRFYITNGDNEKAKEVIQRIYITNGNKTQLNNIFEAEKAACISGGDENDPAAARITTKQALWTDERFVRSSWTAILIMMFQCLTGYYAIIAYSEVLLEDSFGDGTRKINTRQGVYLVQLCNLLGSFASIYVISKVGRRTIFVFGQGGIAFSLLGIAIVSHFDAPVVLLVFICIVAFLFQLTLGPMAPLYAAEVCVDIALGAVMICEDIVVLLQDFVTPTLISSPMGPLGVFLMYGVFSVIGLVYIYIYVPETVGLSETEKREIFYPGAKYGRKLKDGEEAIDVGDEHKSDFTIHKEIYNNMASMLGRTSSHDFLMDSISKEDRERNPSALKLNQLIASATQIKEQDHESSSESEKKSATTESPKSPEDLEQDEGFTQRFQRSQTQGIMEDSKEALLPSEQKKDAADTDSCFQSIQQMPTFKESRD